MSIGAEPNVSGGLIATQTSQCKQPPPSYCIVQVPNPSAMCSAPPGAGQVMLADAVVFGVPSANEEAESPHPDERFLPIEEWARVLKLGAWGPGGLKLPVR